MTLGSDGSCRSSMARPGGHSLRGRGVACARRGARRNGRRARRSAEVQRAGDATWSPLAVGDPVLLGDQLRTPADAKLLIVMREESALTLGPGSQLVITEQVLAPAAVVALPAPARHHQGGRHGALRRAASALRGGDAYRDRRRARHQLHRRVRLEAGGDPGGRHREHHPRTWSARVRRAPARSTSGPVMATRVRRGSRPMRPAALPEAAVRSAQGRHRAHGRGGGCRGDAAIDWTRAGPSAEASVPSRPRSGPSISRLQAARAEAAAPAAAHRSRPVRAGT